MSEAMIPRIEEVKTIAVLGAGTMGHGIAQVAAMNGFRVEMRDLKSDFLEQAIKKIEKNLKKGLDRGKVSEETCETALSNLHITTEISKACQEAQLVIEAVPESIELKHRIFAEVIASAPEGAVLASNTSSLSIADIAKPLPLPQRVIGMHFFNPVHIMSLVEIVKHKGSSVQAIETALGFVSRIGKTAITVKDTPGFASSRLGLVIGLEAMRMFEQNVASAHDIDTAMKLGYGHPMGPLELTDHVGLDVRLSIAEYLSRTVSENFNPPKILQKFVEEGRLGKKTGQGFYTWKEGKKVN